MAHACVFWLHRSAHTSTVKRVPLERHLGQIGFNAVSGYLSALEFLRMSNRDYTFTKVSIHQNATHAFATRKKVKYDISHVEQLTKLEDT